MRLLPLLLCLGQLAAPAVAAGVPGPVTPPPAALKLDPFYKNT